jgi:hypothetical protein
MPSFIPRADALGEALADGELIVEGAAALGALLSGTCHDCGRERTIAAKTLASAHAKKRIDELPFICRDCRGHNVHVTVQIGKA